MIDKLKLLMGRPIPCFEEGNIFAYQPIIKSIVDIGEDVFQSYITPYVITSESIFNGLENENELIEQFHIFDLFFLKDEHGNCPLDKAVFNGKKSLDVLRESLSYFIRTNNIDILFNRKKIIIDNSYLIDKNEFIRLRRIIQEIVGRGDIEFEKTPKNMTKRQKDIWLKLQKGRRRKAERNAIYLQDIINFTSFGGKTYIPPREIEQMTYFQLMNAYQSIVGIESYEIGMQYKLSQKYDVKDNVKHWTETIKIGK